VIPAYNAAPFIEGAIESVYAQTHQHFELIVVDDGSTDATGKILDEYARTRGLVHLHKPNGGVASARQFGIDHARHELVAFLDADDVWLPDKLDIQLDALRREPGAALVFTDMIDVVDDTDAPATLFERKVAATGYVLEELFTRNFIATPTVLVRRSALAAVGGFNTSLRVNEDFDLWLRLAENFRFACVNKVLVRRRIRSDSLTRSAELSCYEQDLRIIDDWSKRRPDLFGESMPLVRHRRGLIHGRIGGYYLRAGEAQVARRHLLTAVRLGRRDLRTLAYAAASLTPRLLPVYRRAARMTHVRRR